MNSELTSSEVLVVDSFKRFFQVEVPITRVREAAASGGFDSNLWKAFVKLGGHSASLQPGGTFFDAVLIGVEAGRALAPIPFVESTAALRLAQRLGISSWNVPPLVDGVWVALPAKSGIKETQSIFCSAGMCADVALMIGEQEAELVVLGDAATRRADANLARMPMAHLSFANVTPIERVKLPPDALGVYRSEIRMLTAALLIGIAQQALLLTRDYVCARTQFERPVGSFQAIQHRLANCATSVLGAEVLIRRAASYDSRSNEQRYFSATAFEAAADAAELTTKESMQFFGGYGYSLEYDIHLYLRAAKALRVLGRDSQLVRDVLADLDLATNPRDGHVG